MDPNKDAQTEDKPQNGGNGSSTAIIVVIVLVLVLAGVFFFVSSNRGDDAETLPIDDAIVEDAIEDEDVIEDEEAMEEVTNGNTGEEDGTEDTDTPQ